MKQAGVANSILLIWLAVGCLAVGLGRGDSSSLKKTLRDFNAPGLKLAGESHHWIEKQWQLLFAGKNLSTGSEKKESHSETSRLQREVLALKELLELRNSRDRSEESTARLFGPKLIAARVLLPDQQQRWKTGTLIDAGKSKKIGERDWIISSELPLIDLGEDYGIKPDEILLSGRAVLGQIDAVGRWTSSYRSITHPKFRCPATVIKPGNSKQPIQRIQAVGSFHGTGNEFCELRYIENTYPVRKGDLVVLADEQQRFEGSLVLGTIAEARVLSNSPYWKILVRPVESEKNNRDVLVIIEELNPLRLLAN